MRDDGQQLINSKDIKKISMILLIIVVVSLVLIISFGKEIKPKEDVIFDSIIKTLTQNSYECKSTIEFSELEVNDLHDPEINLMLDVLNDISLNMVHKYNKHTREIEGIFQVYLKEVRLFEGTIYINNKYLSLEAPMLYSQPIYMSWDDFSKRYGVTKEQLNILCDNIEEKLNSKTYDFSNIEAQVYVDLIKNIFIDTLVDSDKEKITLEEKSISCRSYLFNIETDDISFYANSFIQSVLQDKKLEMLMDRMQLVFLFDEDSYNRLEKKYPYEANVDIEFFFDKHDILRKATTTINAQVEGVLEVPISGKLLLDTEYVKLEDINFNKIDIKKAVNISELNDKEINDLYSELQENFNLNMENNRLYDLLLLDKGE